MEQIEVAIVKASDMGMNCWMPHRFLNKCYKCQKYETCTYPEKISNPEFDALAKEYREKRGEVITLLVQLKKMANGRFIPGVM